MRLLLFLLLSLTGAVVNAQSSGQLGDRSKLPSNLRNIPLSRLSSGALMLLNRDNNLVAPPHTSISAKGTSQSQAAESAPVMLDLRVGPNIRLGDDPSALPPNMRAQAEPDIARSITDEDFVVGTFQEGRFTDGGAVDCGYSVSHDGGLNWTRAFIPNLTMPSGGPYFRATDPVVAFDANNNVYLETEGATDANFNGGAILISKSTDGGATFASPVIIYKPSDNTVFPDKPWMAVNTFQGTSSFGRILATFTLFSNSNQNIHPIVRAYSDDGGAHWTSTSFINGSSTALQGSQPVYLPNGDAVVVYWNFGSSQSPGERLESVISTNGGNSFGSPHLISFGTEWNEPSVRTGSFLPSATADRTTNNVYVVYQAFLNGPHILFTKSTDGGRNWSGPVAISDNPNNLGVFNPAISVSPDDRTLTVCYYDHRDNPGSTTLVNLYLTQSFDGGNTWQPSIRVSSITTDATLAPLTSEGYMLGDYLGIANTTRPVVPSIPIWCDTRTGNSDPFIVRAGIVPYPDLVTGWQAARESLAQVPASSVRGETADLDRDGEDGQSETASATDPINPASVVRSGKEVNLSTRLHVDTGDHVGIAGFAISGTSTKTVLIRALGPSLAQFNVPGVLQDPILELYDANQNLIATNDSWRSSQESQIQATGLAPGDDREAAILITLPAGNYTAIIRGANNTSGIGLIEFYDQNPTSSTRLTNISSRAEVGTSDNVMIAGFIVGNGLGANGDGSSQVLVRVIGPELSNFSIPDPLQDPILELHDSNGTLLVANDNWKDSQQSAIQSTGLAPGDDRESAVLVTLVQGNWTAIVTGKNGTSGVSLVEVYRIQ